MSYNILHPTNSFIYEDTPQTDDKFVELSELPHEDSVKVEVYDGSDWNDKSSESSVYNSVIVIPDGEYNDSEDEGNSVRVTYVPRTVGTRVEKVEVEEDEDGNNFVNVTFEVNDDVDPSVYELDEHHQRDGSVSKTTVDGNEVDGTTIYVTGVDEGDLVEVEYITQVESDVRDEDDMNYFEHNRGIVETFSDDEVDVLGNYFGENARWFDTDAGAVHIKTQNTGDASADWTKVADTA